MRPARRYRPRAGLFATLLCGALGAAPATGVAMEVSLCAAATDPASVGRPGPRLVAGADGWLFRPQQDLITNYDPTAAGADALRALRDALAERGTTLVLVRLPPRGVVHAAQWSADHADTTRAYHDHIAWLREAGLEVVDLSSATQPPDAPFYYPRDHHWTPAGARASAEAVASHLTGLVGDTPLPPAEFHLKQGIDLPLRGALTRKAEAACGPMSDVPDHILPVLRSVQAVDHLDASALFDAPAAPEVVVVGDSQVNKDGRDSFYFVGQLREALGADVANHGVDGGSLFPPMQGYLNSRDFAESPPRFLVWVSGAHLKVHNPARLRQTTPALTADCGTATEAVVVQVASESTPSPLPLLPDPSVLRLDLPDPAPSRMRLALTYADGHSERVLVQRNPRVGTSDPVWLQTRQGHGGLATVAVEALGRPLVSATARVCAERPVVRVTDGGSPGRSSEDVPKKGPDSAK